MVQRTTKVIIIVVFLGLLMTCNEPPVNKAERLQDFAIDELGTFIGDPKLYSNPFTWDTLMMPDLACTAYKLRFTNSTKFANTEAEKITIIVDNSNKKYILRIIEPNLFTADWIMNMAELETFVNEQDTPERIKKLSDIITFHRSSYSKPNFSMANKIDTVLIKQFQQNVIAKYKSASPIFCPNIFKDKLQHFFKEHSDLFEKFIVAYFYDDVIVSFSLWKINKHGQYHLKSKILDTKWYFAKPKFKYQCQY